LLQEYEADCDADDNDGKVLSYNNWATMRAKKWLEMEQSSSGTAGDPVQEGEEEGSNNDIALTKESSSSASSSTQPLSSSLASSTPYSDLVRKSQPQSTSTTTNQHKVSYKDGFLVEVKVQSESSPISPRGGKGGKGKRGKRLKNSTKRTEWRRAIQSTSSTKYHTGKKLLVLLTCFEDDENSESKCKKRIDRCFSGKIVDVQEQHYIRVHYDGLPRSMDSWVDTRIGGKVFLDGGKVDPEEELLKEQKEAALNQENEVNQKVEDDAEKTAPLTKLKVKPRGKFLNSKGKPRGKVLGEDQKTPIKRHDAAAKLEDAEQTNHIPPCSSSSFIQPASMKGKGKVIVKKPTCVASSNANKTKCSKPKPSPRRKPRQPTDIPGVNPYEKSYNNRPTRKRKAICYNENSAGNDLSGIDRKSTNFKKSSTIKLNSNVPEWVYTIQSTIDLKEPKVPPHIQPLPRENFKGRRGNAQYRGVCCQKRKGGDRWQSQISFRGHNHYLGTFDTEWLAAAVFAWAYEIVNGGQKAGESSSNKETNENQAAAALPASNAPTTTNHHHQHDKDETPWSAPTTPCTTLSLNPQHTNTNTITSAHYNITDSAITTNVAAAAAGLLMTPLSATLSQQQHPHNRLCHVDVPMPAAGVVSSTGGGVMPQLPMQFLEPPPMSGAL